MGQTSVASELIGYARSKRVMMCMRAHMINAFLLRRERVIRRQGQRGLEHCLCCTSANQSEADGVLLDMVWDKNRQGGPVGAREEKNRRAWDVVVQV